MTNWLTALRATQRLLAKALGGLMNQIEGEIFKVQISLMTSHDKPQALVYNEDRSILSQFDADKNLLKLMAGEKKKYFLAAVIDSKLNINPDFKIPEQDW